MENKFGDNPYLKASAKELLKMMKKEKINNAVIEEWLGVNNPENSELKKAYRIKINVEKNFKKVEKKAEENSNLS